MDIGEEKCPKGNTGDPGCVGSRVDPGVANAAVLVDVDRGVDKPVPQVRVIGGDQVAEDGIDRYAHRQVRVGGGVVARV